MTADSDCRLSDPCRLAGLRRFAIAITALNVVGHLWLGFEQSYAQPLVGVATAYFVEFLLEFIDARINSRPPRYRGSVRTFIDFFLSAHISGLACAMLMYCNNRLGPVMFAAATAIASKSLFRIRVGNRYCHFLNPSNFGISLTLLMFPWVGIVPPYQFTENLSGWADWLLPCVFICTGSLLNTFCTRRIPLITGWLIGFAAQALIRTAVLGSPLSANLVIMTGPAFILYTFYMITDPATTPSAPRRQFVFGLSVAAAYSILVNLNIVFGMYFGLTIVSAIRGLAIGGRNLFAARVESTPNEQRHFTTTLSEVAKP